MSEPILFNPDGMKPTPDTGMLSTGLPSFRDMAKKGLQVDEILDKFQIGQNIKETASGVLKGNIPQIVSGAFGILKECAAEQYIEEPLVDSLNLNDEDDAKMTQQ